MHTTTSEHDKLWDLIKGIKFGMFTHRQANGWLHSQPLTTLNQRMDEGARLYFFIPHQSDIAQWIEEDDQVNVSYANPGDARYVSVSGRALIVEDLGRKEALWSPTLKVWFPGGPTDPTLALLEVFISHAEYWDVTDNTMVHLIKKARAALTGESLQDMGEHRTLNMH